MIYVLTHGTFEIADTPHKGEILGQQFDMPEPLAKSAILSGAHILPKAGFDAIGFTADDLKFSNARLQAHAPAAFHTKHEAARLAVHEYRALLASTPDEVTT
jgi:hypothetical protein